MASPIATPALPPAADPSGRSTLAGTGDTRGTFYPAQQVKSKQRLVIGFLGMAHRGVPAAATIDCLTPGDRVIGAHCAAGIGRLVERRQDLHRPARITAEVVPFIGALPEGGQAFHRGMVRICDVDRRALNRRMAREPGAHEPAVPRPPILRVTRRVDADEAAARSDVSLKGGLLARVEDIPGRVEEYDDLISS